MKIRQLKPPDSHHLSAAEGWLELGNHLEADAELDCITPKLRIHPDVLRLRWEIYAKAKKWEACVDLAETLVSIVPERLEGWIQRSFALHEIRRTQEAFDKLLPIVKRFPEEWLVPYNLACYCAQLDRLEECKTWFKKAMVIDDKAVQKKAIDDPDLKPLWVSMSGPMWKKDE